MQQETAVASDAAGSTTLHLRSTTGIVCGQFITSNVNAANVSLGTTVVGVTGTTIRLSRPTTGTVPLGTRLTFVHIGNSALTINGDSNQRFGVESPELYIRDTSMHGFSGGSLFTAGGSWLNGIVSNNQTALRIDSAFISFSRGIPVGTGLTIVGSYPIRLSDDHHLTNIRVIGGDVGIVLGGGHPGFEGLMLSDSSLVGCARYGIWASTNHSIEDQMTVTGTHINAGLAALKVDGMTQVGVTNCFFIVDDGAFYEGQQGVGFDFHDVGWFQISGNLVQFNPANTGGGWGMLIDNDLGWGDPSWSGVITGNVFQGPATGGLWFRNHAGNVLVVGNSITVADASKAIVVESTARSIHCSNNMVNGTLVPTGLVHTQPAATQMLAIAANTVTLPRVSMVSLPNISNNNGIVEVGSKVWVTDGCKPHEQRGRGMGCTGVEAVFDSSHQWLRTCDYKAVWSGT